MVNKIEKLTKIVESITASDSYEELIILNKEYQEIDSSIELKELSEDSYEELKYLFEVADDHLTKIQEDYCSHWELGKLLDDKKLDELYKREWELDTGICLHRSNPNTVLECLLKIIDTYGLEKEKGVVRKEFKRIMQDVPTDLPSLTYSNCSLYDWVLEANIGEYFFTTGKPAMSKNYSFTKGATSEIITLY
ncbi:hypothetical protein [Virgibacillus sp.]|uniref:hypothetical protein n=1 Tax=Virgibacillus sp. TaxID=1872700 RepID=UPI0017E7031A|nr:hypothetical protein [Virgibacillus sp.]NWO12702.1 hypothetical protein [Virgibacillus sp.]